MDMHNEHQKLAVQALNQMRGDDLARARMSFRGMNSAQMAEQHGWSGKTRKQILEEYEAHDRKVDAAIDWVCCQ